jgi:carboxyl-terminal processing protease
MKDRFLSIALVLALVAPFTAQAVVQLAPSQPESQAALLSARILTHYHYEHVPLDDELSGKIFNSYLKSLDGNRGIFLQSDIDEFADARTRLDDAIVNQDLRTPFAIYNRYLKRVDEHFNYARALLKKGFDFSKKENYPINREDAPWAKSEDEMHDLWRRRVKNDWLNLKLAGKSREDIVATLDKRYANVLKSVSSVNSGDVFERFMNAYTMAIDPHTNYFGVQSAENFDISMKLSLTGIGAELFTEGEYTTIKSLLAGGPAALSGVLKGGDRIVGVGQGEEGPITDIVGWRINDVVDLIRGPKDTVVRLEILPAGTSVDSERKRLSLVRKKITLEKQAARKSVIEVEEGGVTHRIGVITLPSFYEDFGARSSGEKNYKSASRDVEKLLKGLKKDKVDGILVDLRNNGGGSLSEAIRVTGLFIDEGPVVQERDTAGKITVLEDDDADALWTGPLGVLINRGSASASEIFTAAIQDYGRGVVIGSNSFGKGTVQTVISLDKIAKRPKPELGELKLTVAQFFRINGGTTQLRGVTPDIEFPTAADTSDFGESSFDDALPWSQIKAAGYARAGEVKAILPRLVERHEQRISHEKDFKYLEEDIAHLKALRLKNQVSLNEAQRRKEREAQEARMKAREKPGAGKQSDKAEAVAGSNKPLKGGSPAGKPDDQQIAANEDSDEDILLDEAAHIVRDEAVLLKRPPISADASR